jgi:chromosomal replication initiator protein
VVDLVTEIPLPGRTFCAASSDGAVAESRVALEAFVAGPENRVTASAINRLLACEESPRWSLLTICGPTGTGKTHLARGLVQSWQDRFGADSAAFLPASDFRHALADAVRQEAVSEFRARLRRYSLLVIDDIDRLPRSEYVQQELRFTIDAFVDAGAMLVITSAKPLHLTRELSVDIRSRLSAGLELRLAPPEQAARAELVRQTSAALGRPLSAAAAARMATGVGGTAEELFGALFELNARVATATDDDLAATEDYLSHRSSRRPTMGNILQAVAKHYRVPQKVLKSSTRRQSAVSARAMAVYLARELAELSYERIGQALGGRDHTTIMHNYRKITAALPKDAQLRDALADLLHSLQLKTRGVENV